MIIKIENENSNRRLDKFLLAHLNNAPRSFIYKMLRKKRIKLNNARAEGNEILQAGDEIKFFLSEETLASCKKEIIFADAKPLTDIIFEDENLLIVNKPAGLPSQGGIKKNDDHLLARILFYLKQSNAAICNRLDVNTSGLVVCGKNLHTLQNVNRAFAAREVKKEYIAIVHGTAGKIGETRTLEGIYSKNEKTNTAHVDVFVQSFANPANTIVTAFSVLAVSKKNSETFSLLSVFPITGRSHQIRAHLASIGHPLAGDKKYGGTPFAFARAQLLHCKRLEFLGNSFEAPLPKNFAECVRELFGNPLLHR
jgi:23S rRNA pseudouridine955/2504/2580 synthase